MTKQHYKPWPKRGFESRSVQDFGLCWVEVICVTKSIVNLKRLHFDHRTTRYSIQGGYPERHNGRADGQTTERKSSCLVLDG